MGTLVFNPKKRDEESTSFPHEFGSSISQYSDIHLSKKLRFSPATPNLSRDRPVSSPSVASRVLQYPEEKPRFKRPVHAPCKAKKVGFLRSITSNRNGDCLDFKNPNVFSKYETAKREAFDTLRFWGENKEVIDVDDKEERETDKDGEVSDFEGVQIVEKGKEKKLECEGSLVELEPNCQLSCSSVTSEDGNLKLDSGEEAMEMVSVSPEVDVSDGPLHEKLQKSANKRNGKLQSIGFNIEYYIKRLVTLRLFRPTKKPVVEPYFVPLSEEEEDEVSHALSFGNRRRVLVAHEKSNIELIGELLQCLRPGAWLNDEVINLYLTLLKEREQREPKCFLKCHFFNTFFYKKLIGGRSGYDYKSVRRWTTERKLGYCLIECDKIFVPIHKEIHWCLAVINKKDEKFQYLDSLGGRDKQVMKVLARYFVDEVKDKSGRDIDVSSWKHEFVVDLPEQQNGFDCGMFMIKYADFYSRDVGLCFNQEHMPYFRRRTTKEILRLKAN